MDSEKIATNHVELAISKTGHLVSHINSNDKEPSWDGDVEVYKKSGHVHAKADLILKVPVQVKGHIKPNLKKKSIKYSIQYSDLRNYLYVGGTIFFVVYFDKEDEHYTIYYVGLLPFDLKKTMKVKIVALSYYPLRLPSRFGLRILIHIQSIRLLFSTIFSPSNALAY